MNKYQLFKQVIPLVRSKESGKLTPYIEFDKNTIISLTYPANIISKSKENYGLSSLFGITGYIIFLAKHEIKGYSYRLSYRDNCLMLEELDNFKKKLNSYSFDYKELNDYLHK